MKISFPIKRRAIRTTAKKLLELARQAKQEDEEDWKGRTQCDIALGTTPPIATASFYFKPANCTGATGASRRMWTHLLPPACRRYFVCARVCATSTARLVQSDRSPHAISPRRFVQVQNKNQNQSDVY
ncbi:hypothetical protein DIE06_12145 [Burkholderia sp. Bp8998]|nr:hypothetical protein DIE06_12145 [Burkholderia sp. Bp8998]